MTAVYKLVTFDYAFKYCMMKRYLLFPQQRWLQLTLLAMAITCTQADSSSPDCTRVKDVTVRLGQDASLLCHINNEPEDINYFQKTWKKTGNKESLYTYLRGKIDRPDENYGSRLQRLNEDTVVLKEVITEDTGEYSCLWTINPPINDCANDQPKFRVNVLLPVSDVTVEVEDVKEGEIAHFRCKVKGSPPITYFWMKVKGRLPSDGRWNNLKDGDVTLKGVSPEDAGKYICRADNMYEKPLSSDPIDFHVFYKPRLDPRITQKSEVAVEIGSSVEINLKVIANPAPNAFKWKRMAKSGMDSEDLQHIPSRKSKMSDIYVLSTVTQRDLEYVYVCLVVNDIGSTQFNFTLHVKEPGVTAAGPHIGIIIGACVGTFVIVIICIVLVKWLCIRLHQKRSEHSRRHPKQIRSNGEEMDLLKVNTVHTDTENNYKEMPVYAEVQKDRKKTEAPPIVSDPQNVYQNSSELKQEDQNEYANPQQLEKDPEMHPKIVSGGITYEDPRNFDFDENNSGSQQPKPSEEPTQYAEIHFQ